MIVLTNISQHTECFNQSLSSSLSFLDQLLYSFYLFIQYIHSLTHLRKKQEYDKDSQSYSSSNNLKIIIIHLPFDSTDHTLLSYSYFNE